MPKLTASTVHRHNTQITDKAIDHLLGFPALNSLYIGDTALTDAGLATMQKIKGLELVTLQGTKVSAQGVAALRKALPECKVEWDGK